MRKIFFLPYTAYLAVLVIDANRTAGMHPYLPDGLKKKSGLAATCQPRDCWCSRPSLVAGVCTAPDFFFFPHSFLFF